MTMTESAASSSSGQPPGLQATNDNSKKVPVSIHHHQQPVLASIASQLVASRPQVRAPPVGVAVSTGAGLAALPRRVRPMRPNLRRQVVVAAAGPESSATSIPIELAPLQTAGAPIARPLVPPKRPAYLPARYENLPSRAGPGVVGASKPNRYASWATAHMATRVDRTFPSQHHHHHHSLSPLTGAPSADDPDHPHHHHFSLPFEAASRVLVVNPMQIVNLSEHTKSRLIKIIEALKRFSEQWFSHVLLLMFLAVYAFFGAYIFISFEAPTEQWEKQLIIDTRQRIVNETWRDAHSKDGAAGASGELEFANSFRTKLEDYERLLNRACASGITSSSLENQWTFWGALFYSMTVFTTIGYGHLTPVTFAGRVATMVYAIFGIPILLMVLADLGKLLTRMIKYAFKKFRLLFNKLLHRKTSIRTRKMISDNTSQYIGVARDAFERGFAHIQPYNRFPHAFTRAGSIGRRFYPANHQRAQQVPPGARTQEETDSDTLATAAAELSESGAANALPVKEGQVATEVIITPARQTKPVSPQPTNVDSNSKKSPLSLDAVAQHNHPHHHNHNHGHHTAPHNANSHSNPRAHSPGTPAASAKRKGSLARALNARRGGNATQGSKNSMSRSSSSSVVVAAGQQQQHQQQTGDKQAKTDVPVAAVDSPQETGTSNDELQVVTSLDQAQAETAAVQSVDIVASNEEGIGELEMLADEEEVEEDDDELVDEFDIPVSFALFLLVTYMMFGAVVFSIWEGWNFFDSLYFVFISMSTIGFGDLVPQHPKRMIGTFIYLLFGLALTSMCINVVQEKIHATFLRAKMQIGEKMGLDLDQIMADDYYDCSTMGLEGDECDDSNSAANISQTNSSSGHLGHLGSDDGTGEQVGEHGKQPADHSIQESGSSKTVRSKESMRGNKRRPTTGLPGHNGSSGLSLRRSHSKKSAGRHSSPPTAQNHGIEPATSPSQPVALALQQQQQQHQTVPKIELASELVRQKEPTINLDPPAINQPVARSTSKSVCESLKVKVSTCDKLPDDSSNHHDPLVSSMSQPITTSNQLPRSLSSDVRHDGGRNSAIEATAADRYRGQARSAGSSRRTSVSHELNELDDLISKLSKCQSSQERFGPLLGIPSRGASRSKSPIISSNLASNNLPATTRRGTSMTYRPTKLSLPMSRSVGAAAADRKRSLSIRSSNAVSGGGGSKDSTVLDDIKFSAV